MKAPPLPVSSSSGPLYHGETISGHKCALIRSIGVSIHLKEPRYFTVPMKRGHGQVL